MKKFLSVLLVITLITCFGACNQFKGMDYDPDKKSDFFCKAYDDLLKYCASDDSLEGNIKIIGLELDCNKQDKLLSDDEVNQLCDKLEQIYPYPVQKMTNQEWQASWEYDEMGLRTDGILLASVSNLKAKSDNIQVSAALWGTRSGGKGYWADYIYSDNRWIQSDVRLEWVS